MLEAFVRWIRAYYHRAHEVIHLHETYVSDTEYKYIKDCLDSRMVSTVGAYVQQLEDKVKAYTGVSYAVAMVNGTSALHLALTLADVQLGDLVITSPFTFVATGNAILYTGAKPLFIDIDQHTLGLSPHHLRKFLEDETISQSNGFRYHKFSGARLAACVPVHTFGHPAQIDQLVAICAEYRIPLVEDAAAALGSWYQQKHTGTYGVAGIFSFNGNKIVTAGGGGMLVTNHPELADQALHLSTQAKIKEDYGYWHDQMGYNYRMPSINAALGCAQMEHIDMIIEARKKLAAAYQEFFSSFGNTLVRAPAQADSNYWMHAVFCKSRKDRDSFVQYTHEQGIHTRPAWQLLPRFPMFADCPSGSLRNATYVEDHLACLPSIFV